MSDELSISATVTRDGDTDLELEDLANGYEIVGMGPGGRTWRRDTVDGRYVHGRVLVNAVLEQGVATIVVRVHGATWVEVSTRAQALFDAFAQYQYLVTMTVEGVARPLVCEPADISLANGDDWNKHEAMAQQQTYTLSIPYDPVKVALP